MFHFLRIFWFTKNWGGGKKACSILLWQKSTLFFGINPACIFWSNTYSTNQWSTDNKSDQWIQRLISKRQIWKSGSEKWYFWHEQSTKKAIFKYEKEGRFYLGLAKVESLDGKITGKRCPVFDYTGFFVTIDAYKKEILKEFSRVRNITSPSKTPWFETINPDNIWTVNL